MKIAVVCAVGWLSSHGYQHVSPVCIGSMSEFADVVYLVQSTRDRSGVDELMRAYHNIVHIADERTWFSKYDDEHEVTNLWFHNQNLRTGMQTAAYDKADCILGMHNNWYIPRRNMATMRARCDETIENGLPLEWVNRGTQLAGKLFRTSHHVKFIVNPKHASFLGPDSRVADKSYKWYPPYAQAIELDKTAVIDVPLEMPMGDLAAVWNFSGCYNGRVGGSTVFNWDNFRPIYHREIMHKILSEDALDEIGTVIAQNSREDFVSHAVLRDASLE